jgi:hypothetical protein
MTKSCVAHSVDSRLITMAVTYSNPKIIILKGNSIPVPAWRSELTLFFSNKKTLVDDSGFKGIVS